MNLFDFILKCLIFKVEELSISLKTQLFSFFKTSFGITFLTKNSFIISVSDQKIIWYEKDKL